jgi:hypothetical protein
MLEEPDSCRSQFDAATGPDQQLSPKPALQLPDGTGDGRLRHMQPSGSSPKPSLLHHCNEVSEMLDVYTGGTR